jgi:hypothetical protein
MTVFLKLHMNVYHILENQNIYCHSTIETHIDTNINNKNGNTHDSNTTNIKINNLINKLSYRKINI